MAIFLEVLLEKYLSLKAHISRVGKQTRKSSVSFQGAKLFNSLNDDFVKAHHTLADFLSGECDFFIRAKSVCF